MTDGPLSLEQIRLSQLRGITFDLFGTLAQQTDNLLPSLEICGTEFRSLLAAPLRVIAQHKPSVDVSDVLVSYCETLDEAKKKFGSGQHQELPPEWAFQRSLDRLRLSDRYLAQEMAAAFMNATLQSTRLVPNVLPLLENLQNRGLSLALISNLADGNGGRLLLQRLELDLYFDVVALSGEIGWRKPDPKIYEGVAIKLDHPAQTLLHIGDEWHADVVGACQAGFKALWIDSNVEHKVSADFSVGTSHQFSEFIDLILKRS